MREKRSGAREERVTPARPLIPLSPGRRGRVKVKRVRAPSGRAVRKVGARWTVEAVRPTDDSWDRTVRAPARRESGWCSLCPRPGSSQEPGPPASVLLLRPGVAPRAPISGTSSVWVADAPLSMSPPPSGAAVHVGGRARAGPWPISRRWALAGAGGGARGGQPLEARAGRRLRGGPSTPRRPHPAPRLQGHPTLEMASHPGCVRHSHES